MQRTEKEIGQVVEAVRDSISLASVDLPDEFYPAHLSVALIDAILASAARGARVWGRRAVLREIRYRKPARAAMAEATA